MRVARLGLAVLSLCILVFCVISEDTFVVKTDLIGQDRVKLTWEDIPDKDGNSPARYRVLCTAPDSPAVEAVAQEKMVELNTFKEGQTYTCEVHPIFDDLVEGMEVISANPGTSAPFTIALQPVNPASEEPSGKLIQTILYSLNFIYFIRQLLHLRSLKESV